MEFSPKLASLIKQYSKTGSDISVSMRRLVPEMPYNSPRFTHGIHFYPAKLIPQIPALFLDSIRLPENATVLDPFCGSGTVLLESVLRGHNAIGADANPLARLITKVKTTKIPAKKLKALAETLPSDLSKSRRRSWPDVVNLEYWFSDRISRGLAQIRATIEKVQDQEIQRLLWVSLSQTARKLSKCDLRVAVPVRLNPSRYARGHSLRKKAEERLQWLETVDVKKFFLTTTLENAALLRSLNEHQGSFGKMRNLYDDAWRESSNSLLNHNDQSIDLIVTSPPYAGAQKYIRASSLGLGWTGLCDASDLRALEDRNIGREHFSKDTLSVIPPMRIKMIDSFIERVATQNPLRAKILNSYFREMEKVINNCKRLLKSDGNMVLVAGPNQVCGSACDTPQMLLEIAARSGLRPVIKLIDEIRSRGLMTRRNKTASTIACEHIYLLKHA